MCVLAFELIFLFIHSRILTGSFINIMYLFITGLTFNSTIKYLRINKWDTRIHEGNIDRKMKGIGKKSNIEKFYIDKAPSNIPFVAHEN